MLDTSNKTQIENSLKNLIKDKQPFVAMISGEWGIGKTFFWNEFVSTELKENDVVYISLFGKNSLSEIEIEIVTKLYKYNKNVKKYKKHLDTIGNMASKAMGLPINVSIGSLLSLFNASDFKNIIICLDDFERLSDKVSLKDVMGLISQFKEQKECKIIMILNEGELSKRNAKIFSNYKEKIVDYSFPYMPSYKDLFKSIEPNIEKITFCKEEVITNVFTINNLKNIRIMKEAIYQLSHFNFIESSYLDIEVVTNFIIIALELFILKAKENLNSQNILEILQYFEDRDKITFNIPNQNAIQKDEESKLIENKEYKKYLVYLVFSNHYVYLKEELIVLIYSFIDTHIIDEKEINGLLKEQNKKIIYNQINKDIYSIDSQYTYSFNISNEETSTKLVTLIETNKKDFHFIFSYQTFKNFLSNIKKYSPSIFVNEDKKKNIIENYIKYYADNPYKDERDFDTNKTNLDAIIEDYTWAKNYYIQYKKANLTIDIDDVPKIISEVCSNRNCSEENLYQLNSFENTDYNSLISKNTDTTFINNIVQFCSWSIGGVDINPIKDKIREALQELARENDEYKRKAEKIMEHAKLANGE